MDVRFIEFQKHGDYRGALIALEQDKKYLQALDLKLNSNKLNEIKLKLGRLDKVQGELKSKEQLVRSTFNKFNTNIKDYEKLEFWASQCIDTYPNQSGSYYYFALARYLQNDIEEAEEYLEEAEPLSF